MKKYPSTKISPRGFMMLVAAILGLALLTTIIANAQRRQNKRGPNSAQQVNRQDTKRSREDKAAPGVRFDHDTPPPIMFMNGSFIMEIDKEKFDNDTSGNDKLKTCIRKPINGKTVSIGHIKIIDGSGEVLYRNLKAEGSEIEIELTDGTNIKVRNPADQSFEVETTATNKHFIRSKEPDKALGKRKARYRHKDNSGHEEFIKSVTINQKIDQKIMPVYYVNVSNLKAPEEFRIMIWLHEEK